MSSSRKKYKGKISPIQQGNKIEVDSRFWMTRYGLGRRYSAKETCCECGEPIVRKYVLHPFILPKPYRKGHWLQSDCSCVVKERMEKRKKSQRLIVSQPRKHPLPLRLQEHNFMNFNVTPQNEDVYESCLSFAKNFDKIKDGEGILLLGPSGTGKTHLASAIANSLWRRLDVVFEYMPFLLERMRDPSLSLEPYLKADLLILDDICSAIDRGWTIERLLLIVDTRLTRLKPTIFTSNYDVDDFEKRLGMRTASRILGNNFQLVLTGLDHRLYPPSGYLKNLT